MKKIENKVDNRDKYLVLADRISEEIEKLGEEYRNQSNKAYDEDNKLGNIISRIEKLRLEIKDLERKITGKKEIKNKPIEDPKMWGLLTIPEFSMAYLVTYAISGASPNILVLIAELVIFNGTFIGLFELLRRREYKGVDISECEKRLDEIRDTIIELENEKQECLDNVVTYKSERDEIFNKVTKLESDLKYILNARNKIIEMMLKDAIDSSYVDTSSIDKDLEEKGIVMELK